MDDITLTRDLHRQGYNAQDIARLLATDQLVRVRRGSYRGPAPDSSPDGDHRRLIAATLPHLHPDAVISHGSAAVLHGLAVWGGAVGRVHVIRTRERAHGARGRTWVEIRSSPLAEDEVELVFGCRVTSLSRTVVDLARTLSLGQAVAVADRALANGLPRTDLEAALRRERGWQGIRAARRVVAFASPLAESPGESVSRVRIDQAGLPAPELQYEVRDRRGVLVGRTDFAWPELRTLGEFDGKVKYGRLLAPGDTVSEVVYREKLREDAMRDLSWQMVRWTTPDLSRFGPVADSLRRAFARASHTA